MRRKLPRWLPYVLCVPGVSFLAGQAVVRAFENVERYGREWKMDAPGAKELLMEIHAADMTRFPRERWSMGRSAMNSLRSFSWGEVLDGVQPFAGPTAVVWGSVDQTVPEACDEARQHLPQAKMTVLEGHGHAIALEKFEAVADAFRDLMRETATTNQCKL